ncbi:hypothetical protein [Nocardioides marmoribigeumensis]|uniref:ABC-2 type transport system permease protein n=1 Tax=Nocardioides marmoribigeumensis TaxID=433649 RepID=A0ABU2BVQ7_9ACTN|nr:hypothetical protein [Nocardioides marmoribigeumensis]MDR7362724.1 hypothetical protein [Nocardioides marmoribigeumensis]
MPTGRSSTDTGAPHLERPAPVREGRKESVLRSLSDTRALISFRLAGLRGRSRRVAAYGLALMVLLTLAFAVAPAFVERNTARLTDVLSLLPTAMVGILVIALISAAASGGGRELIPRDQGVAYPVTPLTDHLGALLMAPLNTAWLLQAWTLLGATAYVVGPTWWLPLVQLPVVLWLVCATTIAQVIGWGMEWVRRGRGGPWSIRGIGAGFGLVLAYLIAADRLVPLLQGSPTIQVTIASLAAARGIDANYVRVVAELLVVTGVAVVAGAYVAAAVVRRPARDELRVESASYQPRPAPGSDLVAMMRTDRVGIWRSVPLRRGLAVLAVMPGLVAIAGGLEWGMLTILPGLVASGGALLFGVNSWCLDGRGALWRDSLPASPRLVFTSRVLVLLEVLLAATAGTIVLASLRAGLPDTAELAAVLAGSLVVSAQVVSASLRWSVRRPFPVDLRSARATPAPPLVMVGYSSRLALSTTFVGLFFAVLARTSWEWSVLAALPFVLLSAYRLVRTSNVWADPVERSRVVATVAS